MTDNYKDKARAVVLAALMVLSVFAMAATVPGAVVADSHDEETYTDGDRYWQGQQINVTASGLDGGSYATNGTFDGSYTFEIINNETGELERQIDVGQNDSSFTVDTTRLDTDLYDIVESDSLAGQFRVDSQRLDLEVDDTSVAHNGSGSVTLDSQRTNYDVVVSSGDLSQDELTAAFDSNGLTIDNDTASGVSEGEIVLRGVSSIQDLSIDFHDENDDPLAAGNYSFNFDALDTTASDSVTFQVQAEGDRTASLAKSVVTENEGDVADLTIDVEGTTSVDFQIGSEDVNYVLNGSAEDVDEDGQITLQFNTFHAGDGSDGDNPAVLTAEGDDTVNVAYHDTLSSNLAKGSYDVSVMVDSSQQDRGTFRLSERSTGNVNVWSAPAGSDLSDTDKITDAVASSDGNVASEDLLVFEVGASGLYGYDNWGSQGVHLDFEQTNPGQNEPANEFSLSKTEVVTDADNDRFFVVVDTTSNSIEAGQNYDFTLSVNGSNKYVASDDETETAESSFSVEERSVSFDWDTNEPEAAAGQSITGSSNLAAGTEIDVVAEAGGDNPFFITSTAEVDENGEWAAVFDFSGQTVGTEFTLDASENKGAKDSADGVITQVSSDDSQFDVTVDGPEEVDAGEDAVYTVTVTNNGDEAADACVQFELDGETYDGCGLTIDAGASDSVDFTVDTEGLDGDYAWSVDLNDETVEEGTLTVNADGGEDDSGSSDGDDSDGSDDGSDDSSDDGSDDSSDDGSDDSSSDDSSDDDSSDGDDDGQPGFGVAVALVALLAAAMLALRRQN